MYKSYSYIKLCISLILFLNLDTGMRLEQQNGLNHLHHTLTPPTICSSTFTSPPKLIKTHIVHMSSHIRIIL